MIEQTIYALLKDIAPTYPIHHQKLYPCITYTIISGSERYSHDGNSNLKQVVVQITAWDNTYNGAKTLQSSIFNTIDAYRNYEIQNVFLENKIDFYDGEIDVYYCVTDYRFFYRNLEVI